MRMRTKGDLYKQLEFSLLNQQNYGDSEAVSKSMVAGTRFTNHLETRNADLNQTENIGPISMS